MNNQVACGWEGAIKKETSKARVVMARKEAFFNVRDMVKNKI